MSHPTVPEGSTPPGKTAPVVTAGKWLISLDFDGTLREESGPAVPAAFFTLMEQLRPLGVLWGINTGRTLPYLLSELLPCSPFLPDFICTCERYIYLADATGSLVPAAEHNAECERINLALRHRFRPSLHARLEQIRREHPQLSWLIAPDDPLSVEAQDSATMDALIPLISDLCSESCTIQRAGRYMRFADARFHKGTALAYVQQQLGIAEQHLFIMGDGHNDIDAFRTFPAAFCAAPANAHPEVAAWLLQNRGHLSSSAGVISAINTWLCTRVQGGASECRNAQKA